MADKTLKAKSITDLEKSRSHLQYSYAKVEKLSLDDDLYDERLETLESFSSRFARFSDLLISKYFRFLASEKDPAFWGWVIDLLNLAEKFSWIESAEQGSSIYINYNDRPFFYEPNPLLLAVSMQDRRPGKINWAQFFLSAGFTLRP